MTQSSDDFKKNTLNKWKPILDSMGITDSRADWFSQYTSLHHEGSIGITNSTSKDLLKTSLPTNNFPLLPVCMRVASRTIGMDLVSVQPMSAPSYGSSKEEIERIQAEIKAENRDSKIDSIIKGNEYVEKKIEDHPDYKGPFNSFFR